MKIEMKEFVNSLKEQRAEVTKAGQEAGWSPEKMQESLRKYDILEDVVARMNKQPSNKSKLV